MVLPRCPGPADRAGGCRISRLFDHPERLFRGAVCLRQQGRDPSVEGTRRDRAAKTRRSTPPRRIRLRSRKSLRAVNAASSQTDEDTLETHNNAAIAEYNRLAALFIPIWALKSPAWICQHEAGQGSTVRAPVRLRRAPARAGRSAEDRRTRVSARRHRRTTFLPPW